MKGKIFKVSLIMGLILTMTAANFLFVGNSLVSYALDNISTNNKNVEFRAYFKDQEGNEVDSLEKGKSDLTTTLYLNVDVKQQGYLNSRIVLNNSNFIFKEIQNEAISEMNKNSISLNQINAGRELTLEIPVEIQKTEIFDLNLLDMESQIRLEGIYRDSSERDKEIKADRKVNFKIVPENITSDNIESSATIITNKTLKVAGKNKRVVQIQLNTGLKNNDYPVREININTNITKMNQKDPEAYEVFDLNTMSKCEYNYENGKTKTKLDNNAINESYVLWKNGGNEKIVYTYLYDENEIEDVTFNGNIEFILYNDVKIEKTIEDIIVNKDDEKEEIITANMINSEIEMYKGKLQYGIDREFSTKNEINVNANDIVDYVEAREENVFVQGENENTANILYNSTVINKSQLIDVLGQDGYITISNEKGDIIATIAQDATEDENGNVVVDYGENRPSQVVIKTTKPVQAGKIEITNKKVIKENNSTIIDSSDRLKTKLVVKTNLNNEEEIVKAENNIYLKNTVTSAKIEINKSELSTVIENNVEIKAVLNTKNDSNELYKNPKLNIVLPEEVENLQIENVSVVYDDELKIKDYSVNGKTIIVTLEGEQTHYSDNAIDGANIIITGKIKVNRKVATKDTQIVMTYVNEKAKAYEENGQVGANIKIVAPTDVTTVTTIPELGVEEIGQEQSTEVMLKRGSEAKEITPQIEIINNKEVAIKDIKVLGLLPTGTEESSIGINLTSGINVNNAKVYYSENENATDDLDEQENGWSETIENPSTVKKYLITADEIASQESIVANYKAIIPENLEYNENANQNYEVTYTDSNTDYIDSVRATQVKLTTGIGPKLEAKLTARVGSTELTNEANVRSGEVIKYNIEISNVGTETARNITLSSVVPEGTTLVEPEDNYEYAGASYYKELGKDDLREEINQIPAGEKVEREYEVKVDKNITDGMQTTNKAIVKFDDVTIESNELKSTLKSADIIVTLKRVTDRDIKLVSGESVTYNAIIENISNSAIDNIKVKPYVKGLEITNVSIEKAYIDNEDEDIIIDEQEYNGSEINVGRIESGDIRVVVISGIVTGEEDVEVSVSTNVNNAVYQSNNWDDVTYKKLITMSIKSDHDKYLSAGDNIEYTINIKNDGQVDMRSLMIKDILPKNLIINNIKVEGEEVELPENNDVMAFVDLGAGEETTVSINTLVDDPESTEPVEISNKAVAVHKGAEIASTSELSHIIKASEQENENNGNNTNNGNNSNNSNNNNNDANGNIANGSNIISGVAWYDENSDGKKDDKEETVNGVTVNLLNVETNQLVKDKAGNDLTAFTGTNGTYMLSNLADGKYIVIFNYDTNVYSLTKYKVSGVDETINSNVMTNQLSINGENKEVAGTDIIELTNKNVADINIGLVKMKNFDLKLDKYVSRVLLQNSAGTTVQECNNSQMSKVEVHSKLINTTTAIIEYKIVVTNVGEVEGYAKKIADYLPSDLKFSSELNTDWYADGSDLYSTSLANEKLKAGESRELTLTLTKSMNENNTGLINNMAEIAESYNELGVADSNSAGGNKIKGENDMSSADVIISISTGEIVLYTSMTIIIAIAILSGIAVPIVKKSKKEKNRHKFDKV